MEASSSEQERLIRHQTVDPAALAGAAIAAAVAVFSVPGPFTPMNLVAGLTLLAILLTYELRRYRYKWQNLAFGAVCGLCALMVVGFVTEFYRGDWRLDYWVELIKEPRRSNVNEWYLLLWWLVLTCIFTICGFLGRLRIPETRTSAEVRELKK